MSETDSLPFPRLEARRLHRLNGAPVRPDGDFVLYWMVAARRAQDNLALDAALDRARALRKPLLVLEALRCDYPHASARHHAFVLDGMRDNAADFAASPVSYLPYVEPHPGAGRGLVETLAARACCVITDLFPAFFLPRMVATVGRRLPVEAVAVDGHGLVPLSYVPKAMPSAAAFRHHVQNWVPAHWGPGGDRPEAEPLRAAGIPALTGDPHALAPAHRFEIPDAAALSAWPIEQRVAPVAGFPGGSRAARARLAAFIRDGLGRYIEGRNHPDRDVPSRLSPALHFGHLSAHRVFQAVLESAGHSFERPPTTDRAAKGKREGFWGLPPDAEAFVDQLVVWRETGANLCFHLGDAAATLAGLPPWARETLERHAGDPREHVYELATFERAATHDPLWNAAQRQLVAQGYIHNYLRMLWGKKIVEWSQSPADALRILVTLNDRYALDGRDPNSYCGIGWVLGRHDHPWPPERPVTGTLRPMSSERTAKKVETALYVRRHGPPPGSR